ncbi:protein TolR [Aromatoleum evansii]|uniref:Protein TolR n=1 Tax=Aromatoleum evansii TaxID=59406 RepID=A0ABZ1AJR4_AROEV|nr:protein TolR [Aromatoleum evansii]NMG31385.1 protein TolR [Aromatoleum evansii]WRL46107.1 protein TolR [Aromatoleum evansii]
MRQRRLMNQINVVPYIDVMLVLLVIFMVTAPMIQTGNVELPTVGGVPQPPAEAMLVVVKQDGSLALKITSGSTERNLSSAELLRELRSALERNPQQSVVIAADKRVSYEKVMDTLNGLRQAGIQKVGLQTKAGSS